MAWYLVKHRENLTLYIKWFCRHRHLYFTGHVSPKCRHWFSSNGTYV